MFLKFHVNSFLLFQLISFYRALINSLTWLISLFDDSAKMTFWEIWEKSKSLSLRPKKTALLVELSTDWSWLVRVFRMMLLEIKKWFLCSTSSKISYISFSSNCSMTCCPFAIVSSCLWHKIKTGTDERALSASNV